MHAKIKTSINEQSDAVSYEIAIEYRRGMAAEIDSRMCNEAGITGRSWPWDTSGTWPCDDGQHALTALTVARRIIGELEADREQRTANIQAERLLVLIRAGQVRELYTRNARGQFERVL